MDIGTNKVEDILEFLKKSNFKRIFVICGLNSFKKLSIKKDLDNLNNNYEFEYYFKKNFLPIYEELVDLTIKMKRFDPDVILAIGGGSVIDLAKISNCIEISDSLKNHIKNYSYPYKKKFTKLVAIPTTAGSGAESTSNAVIYLDNIKYSFESEKLKPDFFFLIPELLLSSSHKINASAGFDALAQAMESLIAIKSNEQSILYSKKSIELNEKYFLKFLENPNHELSAKMLIASNLAGKAIDITKTTIPHAVSYPFSTNFGFSHGHAVSLFFEDFFEYNFNNLNSSTSLFNLRERFDILFKIFKSKNIEEFKLKIKNIKFKAELKDNLSMQNINVNKNLDKILNGVNLLRLSNNPIKIDKKNIIKIITSK